MKNKYTLLLCACLLSTAYAGDKTINIDDDTDIERNIKSSSKVKLTGAKRADLSREESEDISEIVQSLKSSGESSEKDVVNSTRTESSTSTRGHQNRYGNSSRNVPSDEEGDYSYSSSNDSYSDSYSREFSYSDYSINKAVLNTEHLNTLRKKLNKDKTVAEREEQEYIEYGRRPQWQQHVTMKQELDTITGRESLKDVAIKHDLREYIKLMLHLKPIDHWGTSTFLVKDSMDAIVEVSLDVLNGNPSKGLTQYYLKKNNLNDERPSDDQMQTAWQSLSYAQQNGVILLNLLDLLYNKDNKYKKFYDAFKQHTTKTTSPGTWTESKNIVDEGLNYIEKKYSSRLWTNTGVKKAIEDVRLYVKHLRLDTFIELCKDIAKNDRKPQNRSENTLFSSQSDVEHDEVSETTAIAPGIRVTSSTTGDGKLKLNIRQSVLLNGNYDYVLRLKKSDDETGVLFGENKELYKTDRYEKGHKERMGFSSLVKTYYPDEEFYKNAQYEPPAHEYTYNTNKHTTDRNTEVTKRESISTDSFYLKPYETMELKDIKSVGTEGMYTETAKDSLFEHLSKLYLRGQAMREPIAYNNVRDNESAGGTESDAERYERQKESIRLKLRTETGMTKCIETVKHYLEILKTGNADTKIKDVNIEYDNEGLPIWSIKLLNQLGKSYLWGDKAFITLLKNAWLNSNHKLGHNQKLLTLTDVKDKLIESLNAKLQTIKALDTNTNSTDTEIQELLTDLEAYKKDWVEKLQNLDIQYIKGNYSDQIDRLQYKLHDELKKIHKDTTENNNDTAKKDLRAKYDTEASKLKQQMQENIKEREAYYNSYLHGNEILIDCISELSEIAEHIKQKLNTCTTKYALELAALGIDEIVKEYKNFDTGSFAETLKKGTMIKEHTFEKTRGLALLTDPVILDSLDNVAPWTNLAVGYGGELLFVTKLPNYPSTIIFKVPDSYVWKLKQENEWTNRFYDYSKEETTAITRIIAANKNGWRISDSILSRPEAPSRQNKTIRANEIKNVNTITDNAKKYTTVTEIPDLTEDVIVDYSDVKAAWWLRRKLFDDVFSLYTSKRNQDTRFWWWYLLNQPYSVLGEHNWSEAGEPTGATEENMSDYEHWSYSLKSALRCGWIEANRQRDRRMKMLPFAEFAENLKKKLLDKVPEGDKSTATVNFDNAKNDLNNEIKAMGMEDFMGEYVECRTTVTKDKIKQWNDEKRRLSPTYFGFKNLDKPLILKHLGRVAPWTYLAIGKNGILVCVTRIPGYSGSVTFELPDYKLD